MSVSSDVAGAILSRLSSTIAHIFFNGWQTWAVTRPSSLSPEVRKIGLAPLLGLGGVMSRATALLENACDMSDRSLIALGDLFYLHRLPADTVIPFNTSSK